jgi:tetratricopeptide (TPR) repeat protein
MVALALLTASVISVRAEIPEWVQHIVARSGVEAAFFRQMLIPGGEIAVEQPPEEVRPELSKLIAAQPTDADLYSLRALEAERQLDFVTAETDWQKYLQLAQDKPAAALTVADFYHRRIQPQKEIGTLAIVASAPAPASEKVSPPPQQRSWRAFERIQAIIQEQALGPEIAIVQYRAWIARYPQEAAPYTQLFDFLLKQKRYREAGALIGIYERAFPSDKIFPVEAHALLEYGSGSAEKGIAVYERSFQPLWPAELVKNYFDLLKLTHNLRNFLERTHAQIAANPGDVGAAARLFYYYQQQGDVQAAKNALNEYRQRKESQKIPWTPDELYTLARLMEGISDYPEAARYYYALYSAAREGEGAERGLAGTIEVLLTAPEQPLRLGQGDLSLYRDIATMDPYPGYWNGILSLLFNSAGPQYEFSDEERTAVPYFHRAKAAELLAEFDQRFPQSKQRSGLHAQLIEVYAHYGLEDAVIREGKQFLASFPGAAERSNVALQMADSYARLKKDNEEFAIYDLLLRELAASADGVPIGAEQSTASVPPQQTPCPTSQAGVEDEEGSASSQPGCHQSKSTVQQAFQISQRGNVAGQTGPRSPDYVRVLDRYLSRLVAGERIPQAMQVYRRELDRNPNDPGLYDRFAGFLEQNKVGEEVEQVYRRAVAKFQDNSWYDKLARWYLRHDRDGDYGALTRQLVNTFSGTELERYFRNAPPRGYILAIAVNRYAHQRFPHDLVFVRNLLILYRSRAVGDVAEERELLRQYWIYDDRLRTEFFSDLSARGLLEQQLASLSPISAGQNKEQLARENPAAARFLAEGEMWRSHFEAAAPVMQALAAHYPADADLGSRSSAVLRSLAAFDPRDTAAAARVAENLSKYAPRDRKQLAAVGDIYADRQLLRQARPYWERMAQTAPGDSAGYLEAATVFWDYFEFDDALRLLRAGRTRLNNPNLYTYEAGAIYENQHDVEHAVDEYARGALADGENSSAGQRLLQLAPRTATKTAVDSTTARLVNNASPTENAVDLRVQVLLAQNRRSELQQFLTDLAQRSTSLELLVHLQQVANQQAFPAVSELVMQRELAASADPVERMQLRLGLMRFHEDHQNVAAARRDVETLYHENPKILGIVRATVDFYWRNRLQTDAIGTLIAAARDSYPDLRGQFTLEAARKATEAKRYDQARQLLAPLLQSSPYSQSYVAAMAETFARSGDDAGLREFYLNTIEQFRAAPLPADERTQRVAELRRALIPALTRLKQYAAAVDQYIELINKYPEDASLESEAALYAQQHGVAPQVVNYYVKTVKQSPRDFRWPMAQARIYTQLEDYPAAIESFDRAIAIRPDRTDLQIARATLEERLLRFDEAARDYGRVYELQYHDPQWMLKVAEIRARQQQTAAAVQAIRAALTENRPDRPENYFQAAEQLERWELLQPARDFAEQGVQKASGRVLTNSDFHSGAAIYARLMTRARQYQAAADRLQSALDSKHDTPETAASYSLQLQGLHRAMTQMGSAVQTYFTPEEKAQFSAFLEQQELKADDRILSDVLIGAARSANLPELEARWLFKVAKVHGRNDYYGVSSEVMALIALQQKRMNFAELGAQLESLATLFPHQTQYLLAQAADAYRSGGDVNAEMRVLASLSTNGVDQYQSRYLALLQEHAPEQLVNIARTGSDAIRDQAASLLVESGGTRALRAVQARGQGLPPVWTKAYTSLTGLYWLNRDPAIARAFVAALSDDTIGARVGKQIDRNQQLAGDIWFYYGSRYGEYLGATKQQGADGYLPANVEAAPGRAAAYADLADSYAERGDVAAALADYERSLELQPLQPSVDDRAAMALWKQDRHDEALARWHAALRSLTQQANGRQPETFIADFEAVVQHSAARGVLPQLRSEIDTLLRSYIHRNGSYGSAELLRSVFVALNDPKAGVGWILEVSPQASDEKQLLEKMLRASWIPDTERGAIYQRLIGLAEAAVAHSEGDSKPYAEQELQRWQVSWIEFLINNRRTQQARSTIDALTSQARAARAEQLVPLEIRLAAVSGTLAELLQRYASDASQMPALDYLFRAASDLRKHGDANNSRLVLESAYQRQIENHELSSANLLGLAEIRLQQNDLPGATELLRRLTLVVGEPFENLTPAADLLLRYKHPVEAVQFLRQRMQAVPWDADVRIKLAEAEGATAKTTELPAIIDSGAVPYITRVKAAEAAAKLKSAPGNPSSRELALLAAGAAITPEQARYPFFVQARVRAARTAASAPAKLDLLREALMLSPDDSSLRLPLFRAALADGRYRIAVSALEPLISPSYQYRSYGDNADEHAETTDASSTDDSIAGDSAASDQDEDQESEDETYVPSGASFLSGLHLYPGARARIAAQLALAYEKLNELPTAPAYYRTALQFQPKGPAAPEWQKAFTAVQRKLELQRQNADRLPVIHSALEQGHLVRPRLTALNPDTPAPDQRRRGR